MGGLFGTDGIRGTANKELTSELAYNLGRTGAHILCSGKGSGKIVIGRDTRVSGDMLESALAAGICSIGVDVIKLGIIPTPAVAYLTHFLEADAGVVISASHNPVEDNGIKFFDRFGYKLEEQKEKQIEAALTGNERLPYPIGDDIGKIYSEKNSTKYYTDHVLKTVNEDLRGMRVVVDCAFGAAWEAAPRAIRELGAEVIPINVLPDGTKINVNCGSTNTEQLERAVLAHKADMGIAHDGDADRVICVDEKGEVVDGDAIMVICGLALARKGKLNNNLVVVTVMSNLGLELAFKEAGIDIIRTPVGDKYVLRKMVEKGASLGGEQSGHIIFSEFCTTGDGIVTASQMLSVIAESGEHLSALSRQMKKLPQVMVNVRVRDKERVLESNELKKAVEKKEEELGLSGRILVRPSGTEPLLRIMVEGPTEEICKEVAEYIAGNVKH